MKKILTAIAVLSLFAGSAFASGSSRVSTPSYPSPASPGEERVVTQNLKCTIVDIAADGRIKLRDNKSERESWISIDDTVKLTAKDKKAFGGRKKLSRQDLALGQLLRVTHQPATGEILRIKVLKQT